MIPLLLFGWFIMKKKKLKYGGQIIYIPIEMLVSDPMRPRTYFNNEELADLRESICECGIIKPLTVRETKNGNYMIISGERRCRAAVLAGFDSVPCILMKMTDEEAVFSSIAENITQSGLNYFEFAEAIERIHKRFCFPYDIIAEKTGMSLNELNEKIKLLSIPQSLRKRMIESGMTERHAKELIKLNDDDKAKLVDEIIQKHLNVTETKRRCREILSSKTEKKQKTVTYFKDITVFVNTIDKTIDAMEKSGINAQTCKTDAEGYIEYSVHIPKRPRKTG